MTLHRPLKHDMKQNQQHQRDYILTTFDRINNSDQISLYIHYILYMGLDIHVPKCINCHKAIVAIGHRHNSFVAIDTLGHMHVTWRIAFIMF